MPINDNEIEALLGGQAKSRVHGLPEQQATGTFHNETIWPDWSGQRRPALVAAAMVAQKTRKAMDSP